MDRRSPTRARVPEVSTVLVSLSGRGTFKSPPDVDECVAVRGSWSCDGLDVTLARFGRGQQVVEWMVGTLEANASSDLATEAAVRGHILHGAHDPEFAGTFSMAPVMPHLQPLKRRVENRPSGPRFSTDALVGNWSLQFTSSSSVSAFVVCLKPDLTWSSIGGVGDQSRLAGKWNVFDDKIDLGSGINGTGNRLWLWLRRFGAQGGEITRGVALNADQLYIGKIAAAPTRTPYNETAVPVARSVKGTVALGWSVEPAFIGNFLMKPWVDTPAGDDD